jgi:beta-lactamase regulating signal transducer with metallopeptidase domain
MDALIAISSSLWPSIVAKATVVLLAGLLVHRLTAEFSAAVRHLSLFSVFGALLVLPVASIVLPRVQVVIARGVESRPHVVGESHSEQTVSPSTSVTASVGATGDRWSWVHGLPIVWLTGAAICLTPVAVGWLQLRRIRRSGRPWPEGQGLVTRTATQLGVRQDIRVLRHESFSGPLTCGLWRPLILFPIDVLQWDERALKQAIVHELEHVRRGDWLTQFIARTVCALYWFHPLVWIAARQLSLEAERASDDAVLKEHNAAEYAALLVSVAEKERVQARHWASAMAGRGELSVRVSSVLDHERRRGRIGRARALATIVSVSCLTIMVSPVATPVTVLAAAQSRAPSTRPQQPVPAARWLESGVASVEGNKSADNKEGALGPDRSSAGTNLSIRTPLGSMTARADAEGRATGLPLYPGAQVLRDEPKRDNGVVGFATPLFRLKVAAATFQTSDPPASVAAFYRTAMSAFGNVVECQGRVEFRGTSNSEHAVCRETSTAQEIQLAVGTKDAHRMVAVKPRVAGSEFALLYVDSRQGQ